MHHADGQALIETESDAAIRASLVRVASEAMDIHRSRCKKFAFVLKQVKNPDFRTSVALQAPGVHKNPNQDRKFDCRHACDEGSEFGTESRCHAYYFQVQYLALTLPFISSITQLLISIITQLLASMIAQLPWNRQTMFCQSRSDDSYLTKSRSIVVDKRYEHKVKWTAITLSLIHI